MTDSFANRTRSPDDPAVSVFDITPDDSNDLEQVTTALNVATPGTVRVTMIDGSTSDLLIAQGTAFPIRAARVWHSGTTATGIKGLV